MKVKILKDTYAKAGTEQSSFYLELDYIDEYLYSLKENEVYELTDVTLDVDNHIKVRFLDKLNERYYTWYLYGPHVLLLEDDGVTPFTIPTKVGKPRVKDNDIDTTPVPKKEGSVIICGLDKPVSLYDSIVKNGSFTWNEALHGGERLPQDSEITYNIIQLATELETIRKILDTPMIVTSWYRPEPYNSAVGGASQSQHLYGTAVDFWTNKYTGSEMYQKLDPIWGGGMGMYAHYPYLLHLDTRGYAARWGS